MPRASSAKRTTTPAKKPDQVAELLNQPWHPKSQRPAIPRTSGKLSEDVREKAQGVVIPRSTPEGPIRDGDDLHWPIDKINVVYNDRKTFDPALLEELAESIRAHGILQALTVRGPDADGCVELIAGERRLRAARLAQRSHVLVRIVQLTDDQANEARMVENVNREGLSSLEEAEGYERLLELAKARGEPMTQQQLARRVGKSQPNIANRLRLLKLPKRWRERLAAGEITAHHAFAILPYVGRNNFLRAMEEIIRDEFDEGFPSVEQFAVEVGNAIEAVTRPLAWEWNFYDGNKSWPTVPGKKLKLTDDQRAKLDVEEIVDAVGRKEERCWNVKEWEKITDEQIRRGTQAEARKAEKGSAAAAKPELTPAEQAERRKKLNDQYAKKLYRYKLQWLQRKLVERLADESKRPPADELTRWLVFFAVAGEGVSGRSGECARVLNVKFHQRERVVEVVTKMRSLTDQTGTIAELLQRWVVATFEGYHPDVRPQTIEFLATAAGIDLAKEWKLDRDFLEIHTREQLDQLAKEWGDGFLPAKRAEAIDDLLRRKDARPPKRLVDCKAVSLT